MDLTVSSARRGTVLWLAAALVTSVPVWWWHAIPVLTGAKAARHVDHFVLVYGHMLGGTIMLFVGAAALYLGRTRRAVSWHRRLGQTYLIGGSVGAAGGLALSLRNAHHLAGITLATGTLAVVWLLFAGLAYRAARSHRFAAHEALMIRSYVLTWTFVGCRLAGRVPVLDALGDAGGAGIVWLSWVGPLLICETVLQWRATKPVRARDTLGNAPQ